MKYITGEKMNNAFSNYFDEFPSKSIAWEHCQDIYWMFVMLDDSGYSKSVEASFTLRQYACQIARDYWNFLPSGTRKAIDIVEKFAVHRQFTKKIRMLFNSLLTEDKSLVRKETTILKSLKLAETAVNLNISAARAASITAVLATELGADPLVLIERLRILVGNPYSIIPEQNITQYWWIVPPKPKNLLRLFIRCLRSWLISTKEEEERKDFNRFLNEYISLASAWDNCQNPNWMLAIIDLYSSHNQIPNLQNKLRKFIGFIAKQECIDTWRYDYHPYLQKAMQKAEQFANEKANLKSLKVAELTVVECVQHSDERYKYSTLFALLYVSSTTWDAVIETLRLSAERRQRKEREINYIVQCNKLRELIENPFV